MASLSSTRVYHTTQYNNWEFPTLRTSLLSFTFHFPSPINHYSTPSIHLHRSFLKSHLNPNCTILRSSLVPPPPPGREPQRFTGIATNFSRVWDTVKIFFAVLFWMSLFFWASAMDRTNSGRGNKKDRFIK